MGKGEGGAGEGAGPVRAHMHTHERHQAHCDRSPQGGTVGPGCGYTLPTPVVVVVVGGLGEGCGPKALRRPAPPPLGFRLV